MTTQMHVSLAGLVCLAAISLGAAATYPVESPEARTDAIFIDYAGRSMPGCAVGVFERGKLVMARGYGSADVLSGRPLTADTLFYAASVSKQFTALAAALLIEEGKLALLDDVHRWIPELPDYGSPITVGMLMHHTSGVRDFLGLLELAGLSEYDRLDVASVLRIVTEQRGLNFTPGTRYAYSNGGYFLLGQVIARVAGQSLPSFAKQRIFAPLGMQHTYFREGTGSSDDPNIAHGYVPDGHGGFTAADGYPSVSGSGGLMISLNDLAKYDRDFHIRHRIWSDRVRTIMLAPGTFNGGKMVEVEDGFLYAGGLTVGESRGQKWVMHSGSATGFRNQYVLLPDLRFSVAAFCNRADAQPLPMVKQVVEAFHGNELIAERGPSLPGTVSMQEELEGTFHSSELGADYVFTPENDSLKLSITSAYAATAAIVWPQQMASKEGDVLTVRGEDFHLERDQRGRVTSFTSMNKELSGVRFVRTAVKVQGTSH